MARQARLARPNAKLNHIKCHELRTEAGEASEYAGAAGARLGQRPSWRGD